ncbi:uncharacterized protein [Apostichopus japonicus]|uniref:uncharacterized protein isoform X2 n=1 Tax=Stichopus japonicus TaxID=307972 RepID=UPI003AB756AA
MFESSLTLLPGNVFTETIEYDVHLSMAALETRQSHGGKFREGEAQVILQTDQGEFVVCTLIFGSVLQQNLNMKIMAGEKVTLYSEGKGTIHLTGHATLGTSMKLDGNKNVVLSSTTDNVSSKVNDIEDTIQSTESDIGGEDCWQAVCNSDVIIKEEPPDSDQELLQENLLTPSASEHSHNGEICEAETSQDTLTLTVQERSKEEAKGKNAKEISPIRCNKCGNTFKSKHSLKRHMASHRNERPHKCTTCGKAFKSSSTLQVHLRTHTGEKPYECQTCHKAFTDLGTCRRHEKIHSGKTPFRCEYCSKGFPENAPLMRHVRIHTGEKPFPCTSCPKRFSDKGQLKRHQRSHLKGSARAVYNGQCDVCGKVLQDASSLKRHRLLHTDLKPYDCTICSKAFNDQSTLRQHYRMHDQPNKQEKHFACISCPAKLKTIEEWNQHSRTCTSVEDNETISLEIVNVALNPVIKEEHT